MYSERGRYVINIYNISREISIEHPGVGLASLAQLGLISHATRHRNMYSERERYVISIG